MPATLFLTLRSPIHVFFFFFNDTATTEIYTLSLHDALPIFFRQLQRLSLSYHDSVGTADSVYRIQNDSQAIRYLVIDGFIPSVGAFVTLVSMIYVMIRMDWQLTLLALAISPPILLATQAYRPRLRRQSREVRKLESAAMAVVHEVLSALRVVKA